MSERLITFTVPSAVCDSVEDRYLVLPNVPLFAIFDAEARADAAEIAAHILHGHADELRTADSVRAERILLQSVQDANRTIFEASRREHWAIGGTTFTACTIAERHLIVVHVGDSRLYVADDQLWRRVTRDHSLFEDSDMFASRSPSERAQALAGHETVITRVLGVTDRIQADSYRVPIENVSGLLLCTDGAWRLFDPPGQRATTPFDGTIETITEHIKRLHLSSGASDDATVVGALIPDAA